MPWLETLTLSLGASVAKHILKSWLGDGLPNNLLGDLVDFIKDESSKANENSQSKKQIDKIGEQVAKRLLPLFDSEGIKLEENQKNAVAIELARTLSKCEVTSKLLVECNLSASALGTCLENSNPDATKLFSEAETSLYKHILQETCQAIIEIATDLASFEAQFATSVLESQDQIYNSLVKLLEIPSENSKKYENEYRRITADSLNRVEMFGVPQYDLTARKQNLTIAYIPLDVNLSGRTKSKDEEIKGPLFTREIEDNKGSKGDEKNQNTSVNLLLAEARRIVIRGYAGSGKTTLMKWIAVKSASRDFPSQLASWNNTIPLFIPLREYVNSGFPDLEEFPRSIAKMLGGKPDNWVHEQLDNGRGVVLIDGVDELPSTKRQEMLEHLNQLVATYPFARYVVTSRPHALKEETWPEWQEWMMKKGFVETTLQPMSLTYMGHFIDHWHLALSNSLVNEDEKEEIKRNPDGLRRILKRRPALRRLATNPLLCAMICALYRERRQSLPSERLKIYQECVEMLISRREEPRMAGLGNDYPELTYSQQIALIQGFAYWLMHNGYSDREILEVDHYFESRIPYLSLTGVKGEDVRRLFVERSSLLIEPILGRISFAHRTFQEFLAAKAAVNEGDFGFLIKSSLDDQWQEVIILAAGESRPKERSQLLKGLISKAEKLKRLENKRQIYLIALACLETSTDLDPETRKFILEKTSILFPPKDEDEAKLIAGAGDPAVELLRLKPSINFYSAGFCINALGLIGTDTALSALSEYAQDVRFKSLGFEKFWGNFDRELYAQKILFHIPTLRLHQSSSLDGIQNLTDLEQLGIFSLDSDNLKPLSSLDNLKSLTISSNSVTDLSPIEYLSNLTKLSLHIPKINDISALKNLQNLVELSIKECSVSDFSPICNLVNITKLSLDVTQVADYSSLSNLSNLRYLSLDGDNHSDLSILAGVASIKKLKRLTLEKFDIDDINHLAKLSNLKNLMLFSCKISDISKFRDLPELQNLFLLNTKLENLNFPTNLNNIKNLTVNTELDNVSVLKYLPDISSITLDANRNKDLSLLEDFPKLNSISLMNGENMDITPFTKIPNLKSIFIYSTLVNNLSLLAGVKNLESLGLFEIRNTDLSSLSNIQKLKNLDLYLPQNQTIDLSSIKTIKTLDNLTISNLNAKNLESLTKLSVPVTLRLRLKELFDFYSTLQNFSNIIGLEMYFEDFIDLTSISHLTTLTNLSLSYSWIINFSQITKLTRLEKLDLGNTNIIDLTPLAALTNLSELDISSTLVKDVAPLLHLSKLRKLRVVGTRITNMDILSERSDLEILEYDD